MEPRDEPPAPLPALRREVERPGQGGHGVLPIVVLAAAMTSTLAAAAMAMSMTPHARHHCARHEPRMDAPRSTAFARPAAPRGHDLSPRFSGPDEHPGSAPAVLDSPCAPRVYRGAGDVQEWTYETCASAPMPRHFDGDAR